MLSKFLWSTAAALLVLSPAFAQPIVVPAYQDKIVVDPIANLPGFATQMAFGPDGRIYVMTTDQGVIAFTYDKKTGQIGDPVTAVDGITGIGIGFHKNRNDGKTYMYVTGFDDGGQDDFDGIPKGHGYIMKLSDDDQNGVYGEIDKGELRVKIVNNLPVKGAGHVVDQLQISGDKLYVGVGRRTINGRRGPATMGEWSDDPTDVGFWQWNPDTQSVGNGTSWGDSVYNGTICYIRDLNTVANTDGSANGFSTAILSQKLIQTDTTPLGAAFKKRPDKLQIHSAGTRNPFGLCLDKDGNLWFTNNYNRCNTLGNGFGAFGLFADALDDNFSDDVHDQLFKAQEGADYGFWDDNWRPKNPMMDSTKPAYKRVNSTTFDNLFNRGPYKFPYPFSPIGLGPHASADGCSFFYVNDLPRELQNNIFITRWNGTVTEADTQIRPTPRSLTYSDIVAVDTKTGAVRQIAFNFNQPLPILFDGANRLLVIDGSPPFAPATIYALHVAHHIVTPKVSLTRTKSGVAVYIVLTNDGDVAMSPLSINRIKLGTTPALPGSSIYSGYLPTGASVSAVLNFPNPLPTGAKMNLTLNGTRDAGYPVLFTIPVVIP